MRYYVDIELAESLGLRDRKMHVYFGLCRLCYKQPWKRNNSEFARLFRISSHDTAQRLIDELINAGLVNETEVGLTITQGAQSITHGAQSITHGAEISKEERTKEENINKEKSGVVIDSTTHTTFIEFFKIISPNGEYKKYEKNCKKIWEKMPEAWKNLAIQRAGEYVGRNPLYYLQDEDFLRVQTPSVSTSAPDWLVGTAIDDKLKEGKKLCVCKNPETGLFGTLEKSEAERFGLEISFDM